MTHNCGQRPIAIGQPSDSHELKNPLILFFFKKDNCISNTGTGHIILEYMNIYKFTVERS